MLASARCAGTRATRGRWVRLQRRGRLARGLHSFSRRIFRLFPRRPAGGTVVMPVVARIRIGLEQRVRLPVGDLLIALVAEDCLETLAVQPVAIPLFNVGWDLLFAQPGTSLS